MPEKEQRSDSFEQNVQSGVGVEGGSGADASHVSLSQTRASHSEIPHCVPRASPRIRTYRALRGANVCTFRPGELIDRSAAVDHALDPDSRVWIPYRDAYATSQFSSTRLIVRSDPRSTSHHWLSANADDQRVAELPSFARLAPRSLLSVLDALAGRSSARSPAHAGEAAISRPPTTARNQAVIGRARRRANPPTGITACATPAGAGAMVRADARSERCIQFLQGRD